MDMKVLQGQYAALIAEAKKLAEPFKGKEADMPQEVADQIAGVLGKTDEIKARIEVARRMAEAAGALESQGIKAANLGWRKTAPNEGDAPVDAKSWREIEIKTAAGVRRVRYNVPVATEQKGYPNAFEAYLRKGLEFMRVHYPEDFKTLTVASDVAGGFLVPPEYNAELIKRIMTMAVVRQYARVAQTSRDVAQWPRINYTDATDADRYTSGVRFTWTGESPASSSVHRVTDPVFGLLSIPVNTAMASFPISNNLIEDGAFDIMGMASELLAEAFALGEDDAFINGTGAAQPRGILAEAGQTGGIATVNSGSTSAPYFTYAGLLNLEAALPSQYEANAVWLGRKATYNYIRQVQVTANSEQLFWTYMVPEANTQTPPRMLLGYPIVKSEFMPVATGSGNYALLFGDLRGYLVLDRVGFSVQRLAERYAEDNITLLLARRRVGGQLIEPWRLRVATIAQ